MWDAIVDYFLYIANHLLEIIGSSFFQNLFVGILLLFLEYIIVLFQKKLFILAFYIKNPARKA